MKMRHLFIMLTAVWSTLGMISLANAEGPIEEVIVTAERRAESLQSVAVAVTAFTGEEMDAQGIVDIKGITERTPGFTMGTFNPGQPQFYIRGIGSNEDGAGGDQSVIVFVDEVYIGRSAGSDFDLFDLERVEVLRGPQGTLFGKNVIGGAVSLVTKKPTEETRMKFEGTAGNLGEIGIRGLVSGELAENVYGKVSISSRRRDGYVDSRIDEFPEFFPDTNVDDQHDINTDSLRAALRMTPSDRLEVNLSANWSQMDRAGPTYISIGPGGIPYGANASLDPNYGANIHENFIEDPGSSETDISGFTARFDYELTDSMSFTSLTSFRSVESEQLWALSTPNLSALFISGGAIPLYLVGNNNYTDESDTFTHEFRLTGGNDKLFWIAGLYYMTEETDRFETSSVGLLFPGGGGVPGSLPGIVPGDDQGNETTSYSVFGQFTYNITDALAITLGGRQSFDKKDITRVGTPSPLSPNRNFNFTTGNDWDAFTGKFTVEWQATENAFLYGTISEGYKAGGYQGLAATELIAITPFDPEEATLYEIGAKTEWFDNRLRLNLAVFQTDYSDLQILQLLVEEDAPFGTGGQLITQNAADADI
ncbi:MAG: TonB-dependent receptor, partial [Pseudomonadales bacterium]|nr:TonB-dependent receptor [Pseudomonadales bacterium]